MIYMVVARPMYSHWSGFFCHLNEWAIYSFTLLTFLFTDFVHIDTEKYKLGQIWIYIVSIVIVLDFANLFVSGLYTTKLFLESWIAYRRRKLTTLRLIKEGKITLVKDLTPHEKKMLAFKKKQDRIRKKQRKERQKELRSKRKAKEKRLREQEEVLTPVYSEGQLEMVDNFKGIFQNDDKYKVLAGIKPNEEEQQLIDD